MQEDNNARHEGTSNKWHARAKARLAAAARSLTWEDGLLVLIILFFVIVHGTIIGEFKQLPGPLYGGDYYNHFGEMLHLYQGGSVFDSGQMLGIEAWTPWFYHLLVVWFSKLAGLTLLNANLYSALILIPISAVIMYLLGQLLFKNKLIAIIPTILLLIAHPIFKYTPFAFFLLVPLYYLVITKCVQTKSFKYAVAAGFVYGLIGITHSVIFMAISFYSGMLALFLLARQAKYLEGKLSFNKAGLKRYFLLFLVIFAIGTPIAMLYWYAPLFIYHGQVLNPIQESGFFDVSTLGQQLDYIFFQIKVVMFNFSTPPYSFYSAFTTLGLVFLIFLKKKTFAAKMILLSMIIGVLGFSHHLITEPLFGTHVFPAYFYETIFAIWAMLVVASAFAVLHGLVSRIKAPKILPTLFLLFVIAMLMWLAIIRLQGYNSDRWTQTGKQQLQPYVLEMSSWVMGNTGLYDVFLSTNENSFALNALTGRKIMTNRITHSSSYVNMDQRMMDAAVILYGNNEELRTQLIKQYSVKYLFWEYNWIGMEFSFDSNGQFQGFFDPYLISDTSENRKYLSDNGVNFTALHTWKDPAYKIDKAPQYDVLVVLPSQFNPAQPWSNALQERLTVVKEFNQSGQTAARIYSLS